MSPHGHRAILQCVPWVLARATHLLPIWALHAWALSMHGEMVSGARALYNVISCSAAVLHFADEDQLTLHPT